MTRIRTDMQCCEYSVRIHANKYIEIEIEIEIETLGFIFILFFPDLGFDPFNNSFL